MSNVMRHEYVALTPERSKQIIDTKDYGLAFWDYIDSLGHSRELALAKTKIEEAVMWATKHLSSGL